MMFAARLDEIGKPAWLGLMIVSFVLFWPAGLVILGYLIGSGRMGCWSQTRADVNANEGENGGHRWQRHLDRMQRKMDRMQAAADRFWGPRPAASAGAAARSSSGNRAFDEYREETLRRLENEQREFLEFLQRLRHAKDKAEFDQFMADRRNNPPASPPAPTSA
jgi:hypothetical protein